MRRSRRSWPAGSIRPGLGLRPGAVHSASVISTASAATGRFQPEHRPASPSRHQHTADHGTGTEGHRRDEAPDAHGSGTLTRSGRPPAASANDAGTRSGRTGTLLPAGPRSGHPPKGASPQPARLPRRCSDPTGKSFRRPRRSPTPHGAGPGRRRTCCTRRPVTHVGRAGVEQTHGWTDGQRSHTVTSAHTRSNRVSAMRGGSGMGGPWAPGRRARGLRTDPGQAPSRSQWRSCAPGLQGPEVRPPSKCWRLRLIVMSTDARSVSQRPDEPSKPDKRQTASLIADPSLRPGSSSRSKRPSRLCPPVCSPTRRA